MRSLLQFLGESYTESKRRGYVHLTPWTKELKWYWNQGHLLARIRDRIKWHVFPKLYITPAYPTHLEVEAASACQMRCPMCAQGKMYEKGVVMGNMDFELFKKIIDEVHDKVFSIKLSWRGEPSLNPDLFKMIRYAKKRGVKNVAFLTNFEPFTKAMIDDFLTVQADYISISFDGLREIYERIRYPAKFDSVVENVRYLRQRRDALGLKRPLIRVQSLYSAIKDNPEEYLALWEPIADKVNFIADQFRASLNLEDYDLDSNYMCPTPWQRMAIADNGQVLQCKSDYGAGGPMGDLRTQTVYDVWHGPAFRELRRLMQNRERLKTKPCQTCSDGALHSVESVTVRDRAIPVRLNMGKKIDAKKLNAKTHRWKRRGKEVIEEIEIGNDLPQN